MEELSAHEARRPQEPRVPQGTRALLTALAVVLGVSMISGTYVLTDTIDRAFTDIFTSSYRDTSVVISGRQVVKGSHERRRHGAGLAAGRVRAACRMSQAAAGSLIDLQPRGERGQAARRPGQGRRQARARRSGSASTRASRASTRSSSRTARGPQAPATW